MESECGAKAPRLDAQINSFAHPGSKASLFQPLTFSAHFSQITCVVGASGTGKTTFLRILLGEAPGSLFGTVSYHFKGSELAPRPAAAAGLIGALFQGDSLVPWKRVEANLVLPYRLNQALRRPDAAAISAILDALRLDSSVLLHFPHQLSLGMRQRVQYARLLLYSPQFLLLDEPFLGLDPLNIDRLAASLREYVTAHAACCVMVTHDLTVAHRTADTFFYLSFAGSLKRLPDGASKLDLLGAFSQDDR